MKYLCEYSYMDNDKNKVVWIGLGDCGEPMTFDYGRYRAKAKVLAEYGDDIDVKGLI